MTGFAVDRRRPAVTYAVLVALGLVYTASLAIFALADRRPAGVTDALPPVPIALSVPMRVAYGGCKQCRRSGWGAVERDWTWTTGETATLIFAAPAVPGLDARELILDVDAVAFLGRTARTLRVSIGGEVVGEAQFPVDPMNGAFFTGQHFVHSFQVPGRLLMAAPTVLIELHMASIGTPRMYYLNSDRRELGVAVRSVSFRIAE
jgi:hypothetical protein